MKRFLAETRRLAAAVGAAIFVSAGFSHTARAEFLLTPLRQVVSEETPEAHFTVSNPSRRILEGRVSWIDLTATETGYAVAKPESRTYLSAAPYLEVAPAQFRLEPGAQAEITVKLREGVRPPKGERRSHLLVEAAAARTPIRKASQGGLELDIGLGVSAPVILRGGRGAARASISKTRLLRDADGLLELSTTIEPKGTFSAYGRVVAIMRPAHGDENGPQVLAERNNVAGYLDAPARRVSLPLGLTFLPEGVLELRYEGAAEFEGEVFTRRIYEIESR
ncbi:MAG: hypothetical protein ACE5FO_13680 [Parvularculaceae bacterium]